MKPLKIQLSHGTWWLAFKRADSRCLDGLDGSTDPSDKKGRKWIYISKDLENRALLETIVHEVSHAADERASEEAIEEQGRVIADVLWRLGWRPS